MLITHPIVHHFASAVADYKAQISSLEAELQRLEHLLEAERLTVEFLSVELADLRDRVDHPESYT